MSEMRELDRAERRERAVPAFLQRSMPGEVSCPQSARRTWETGAGPALLHPAMRGVRPESIAGSTQREQPISLFLAIGHMILAIA